MRAAFAILLGTLALAAARADAAEASTRFTVGARVIRSAAFSVREPSSASPPGLTVRAVRGAPEAGVAVATQREFRAGAVRVTAAGAGLGPARDGAEPLVVTVLPDGRPPSVRFTD